jgi:hypothetical protein
VGGEAPYVQHHIIRAVGASVHSAFKFAEFIQTVMPAKVFMPVILLAGTKTGYRQPNSATALLHVKNWEGTLPTQKSAALRNLCHEVDNIRYCNIMCPIYFRNVFQNVQANIRIASQQCFAHHSTYS